MVFNTSLKKMIKWYFAEKRFYFIRSIKTWSWSPNVFVSGSMGILSGLEMMYVQGETSVKMLLWWQSLVAPLALAFFSYLLIRPSLPTHLQWRTCSSLGASPWKTPSNLPVAVSMRTMNRFCCGSNYQQVKGFPALPAIGIFCIL